MGDGGLTLEQPSSVSSCGTVEEYFVRNTKTEGTANTYQARHDLIYEDEMCEVCEMLYLPYLLSTVLPTFSYMVGSFRLC